MESKKRKSVIIQVTENCNLHCVYCYQNHNTHTSNFITIQNIIAEELSILDDNDEVEFDFIGGEPLLEFELIKSTCEWTWQQDFSKPHIFFATTNGTLLNDTMRDWFKKHKNQFWLGLSIDGTKEMHNTNRCNSYEKIDINFFLTNWPDQPLKMTVSPATIGNFAEGVIELTEKGFIVSANLAYGINWDQEENQELFTRELKKLASYYIDHPEKEPIMLFDLPLYKVARNEISNYCGTGTAMVAYNFDGIKYPCQMFYPVTFDDDAVWKNTAFSTVHLEYYANCDDKQLFPVCPMCVGMNIRGSGSNYQCDKSLCSLLKILIKANAWFKAQRLKDKKYAENYAGVLEDTVKSIRIINTL